MAKKTKTHKKTRESSRKALLYIQHTADPLFAAVAHPSEPVLVTGSATGRVQAYRYNKSELREVREDFEGTPYVVSTLQHEDFLEDTVEIAWTTNRHKGSCRGLCFDLQSGGEKLYSIGSEGVVKMSDVRTGAVLSKFSNPETKFTKCVSPPGKPYLVVGDEIGNVYCHDTRAKDLKLCHEPIRRLHNGEGINGIAYCWPKSDYRFITFGSTSVSEIDLRKPEKALNESEDQEDEVVCGVFVNQEKQDTMLCGMGEGVVTVWKPDINRWEDQVNRIKVAKDESIDAIVSAMDAQGRYVYAGAGDGTINRVDVLEGRCVDHLVNRDPEKAGNVVDEVTILDLDHEYRLIAGGMDGLTLWDEEEGQVEDTPSDSDSDDDHFGHSDSSHASDSDSDRDRDLEESEPEQEPEQESEQDSAPTIERRSVRESMKRRLEHATTFSNDEELPDVPDSDDEPSGASEQSNTVPLSEIRDKLLSHISEAYKTEDDPVDLSKLSKRQRKKLKIHKPPPPEHGIFKFDDL